MPCTTHHLACDCREARMKRLEEVAVAARGLHVVVGDGDNGPARTFNEAWYELDDALQALAASQEGK